MERKCKDCGLSSNFIYIDKKSSLCDNCESARQYKKTKKRRAEIDNDLFTSTRIF